MITVQNVLFNFFSVILEFLFELYVFYVMFLCKLHRKKKFGLRVGLSTLAVVVVAFGVAALYTVFGETLWGRILIYLFLFSLTAAQCKLLFDESFWTVVFCCSIAYAAQNLVYKLYLFQYYFGKLAGVYDFAPGVAGTVLYRLMYYTVFAVLSACVYFLLARQIYTRLSYHRLNYKFFVAAFLILGVTVILCSMEDLFFERAGMGVSQSNIQMSLLFLLRQTGNALSAVCSGTILLLMFKTLEQRDLLQTVERLQHAIRQSEQQYHISKDTIKMINIKCHDIKYKLDAAVGESGMPPDRFDDLRQSIAIYDCNIETGNKILNVLFTEKSLYCERNGISLSCMIDGARLNFIQPGDLYCLFGNIADNALEAVVKIPDKEKRVINIVGKAKDNMVVVQAENFFVGDVKLSDGLPLTTKDDTDYHGFGMQSMRMIAHKYGGELIVKTDGDVFTLTLLFPDTKTQNA